jgi:hypothetical protein
MSKEIVYWTMKSGIRINVDHMDLNHLRNTLKMIIRTNSSSPLSRQQFRMNGELANDDAELAMLYNISPELTCTCDEYGECQQCYQDRKNESDLNAFESQVFEL